MTNKRQPVGWQVTQRDFEILAALELLPLTALQLLKWSERFSQTFTDLGALRRRFRQLVFAGFVQRWPLAIVSRGSTPYYHKLTVEGHRLLHHGANIQPTRKRAFSPIGPALHFHTQALSEFIVHLAIAAHRIGVSFTDLYPENAYRIVVGKETLKPDWRFSLVQGDTRRTFNVELDNSTESVLPFHASDSIARKIRLLDAEDSQYTCHDPRRAITLFVTTRSRERMQHILDTAAMLVSNPERSLIYAAYLPDVLSKSSPLTSDCFLDHRSRSVALLPKVDASQDQPTMRRFGELVGV